VSKIQSLQDCPLISIVMPSYNTEKFIKTAIDSILQQTYTHWELIIVDDGSLDNTISIIQQIADSRIKLIKSEHLGYIGAIHNIGLKACQGEFIAFLDSDDVYEPYSLEVRLSYLLSHPDCTAVYGFLRCIDETGHFLPSDKMVRPAIPGNTTTVDLTHYSHTWKGILCGDVAGILPSTLMRRETFNRVGYEHETFNFAHDYLYYIRLFIDSFEGIHAIPTYVFRYRRYTVSNTRNKKRFLEALADVPQYCDWVFGAEGIPAEYHYLASVTYARQYGHLARSRLLNKDFYQLTRCVFHAFRNSHVTFKDWLVYCFPFWIRYFSPAFLDKFLIAAWSFYKLRYMYRKPSSPKVITTTS
jgi:glycosyltransferase involved in cell wall biosynthesis